MPTLTPQQVDDLVRTYMQIHRRPTPNHDDHDAYWLHQLDLQMIDNRIRDHLSEIAAHYTVTGHYSFEPRRDRPDA